MTSPLDDVYKRFEHLDGCLSDPEWCTSGDGAAIYAIAGELWRAVKEARENPCIENGCTDIDNCDEICQHSRIYSPVQMQQAIAQATAAENKRILGGDIDWEEIGFRSGSDLFDRVFKAAIMSSDDDGILDTDKFIGGLKALSESLRTGQERE